MNDSNSPFETPCEVSDAADCYFYHSMDLPSLGPVRGDWDLRPGVSAYLGGVSFAGKRVLEIGPASGFLTFHMEAQGAEVVCVDVADDAPWNFVPQAGIVTDAYKAQYRAHIERMKRGFWLAHRAFRSRAKVHYGDATRLPAALGRFDIALMGNVLLHCRDAMGVLCSAAALADQKIIVTDWKIMDVVDAPIACLVPTPANGATDTWWGFTPSFIATMLGVLGFARSTVTFHSQLCVAANDMRPMFTVLGERP